MIYILKNTSAIDSYVSVDSVWEVEEDNVEELYKEFAVEEARELGLSINPHWLNLGSLKHNSHLTSKEYKKVKKDWGKFLREKDLKWYIKNVLWGVRLDYEEIYI